MRLQPTDSQTDNDRLTGYFELLAETGDGIWVESCGLSMLLTFYRGVEVHVTPIPESVCRGDIVVFFRDNKFIAHRVLFFNNDTDTCQTKGDTLFFSDPPIHKEDILGIVDRIRKKGKEAPITGDPAIANLSGMIGAVLAKQLRFFPIWLKFITYFCIFSPLYLLLLSRRFFMKNIRKKSGK